MVACKKAELFALFSLINSTWVYYNCHSFCPIDASLLSDRLPSLSSLRSFLWWLLSGRIWALLHHATVILLAQQWLRGCHMIVVVTWFPPLLLETTQAWCRWWDKQTLTYNNDRDSPPDALGEGTVTSGVVLEAERRQLFVFRWLFFLFQSHVMLYMYCARVHLKFINVFK